MEQHPRFKGVGMSELEILEKVLSSAGDDAIYALLIYKGFDFVTGLLILSFAVWASKKWFQIFKN